MTTEIYTYSKTEIQENELRRHDDEENHAFEQIHDHSIASNCVCKHSANSDPDDDDVEGVWKEWEDGGNWEKFDESGVSLFSKDQWTAAVKNKENRQKNTLFVVKKKKMMELLTSSSRFEFALKKYLDPDNFPAPEERLPEEYVETQEEDKLSSELIKNMDEYTFLMLGKMVHQHIIKDLTGIISFRAKHAILLQAMGHPRNSTLKGKHLAVKIFKKTFIEHAIPTPYSLAIMHYDWDKPDERQISRTEITSLAEKEFNNLQKMGKLGIACPEPIKLPVKIRKHIVVMSYIGECEVAAPKLKDCIIDDEFLFNVYKQIITTMRIMYQQAKSIHCDILEHTLWFNDQCFFVDFSSVLNVGEEGAEDVLIINICSVSHHFSQMEFHRTLSPGQLLKYITSNSDKANNYITFL